MACFLGHGNSQGCWSEDHLQRWYGNALATTGGDGAGHHGDWLRVQHQSLHSNLDHVGVDVIPFNALSRAGGSGFRVVVPAVLAILVYSNHFTLQRASDLCLLVLHLSPILCIISLVWMRILQTTPLPPL